MSLGKVYLDTSVISALFDERTPERQQLTNFVWQSLMNYDVYISEIVLQEIDAVSDTLKPVFQKAIKGFNILKLNSEIENLAKEYVRQGIFPEKYYDDAHFMLHLLQLME
jgi:predicted nucleic acid-binding protein